ncbi:hypothetical protein [Myceligenerans salitolerans]|uniref:Uncharacterized protein n=1 Tax=Myceligenerans salitolerans TaxID=1230528 RepID=A0ABS3I913_9MICO|nr:hypothetical protein [Myceligenerans salitolerans]MBO0609520.1 hypothetical protein [Myceligenerans salitolerans]
MASAHHRIPRAARTPGWIVRVALSLGIAAGGLLLGAPPAASVADGPFDAVADAAPPKADTVRPAPGTAQENRGSTVLPVAEPASHSAVPQPRGEIGAAQGSDAEHRSGDTLASAVEGSVSLLRASGGEATVLLASLLVIGLAVFRGRTQERPKPHSLACFEVPVSPA